MRKTIGDGINVIFGWGIYVALFAGGLATFGFIIAMLLGPASGEGLAVFLQKQYFPLVIRIASFIVILGLVGMYVNRQKALSMATEKQEADAEIEESKRLYAKN